MLGTTESIQLVQQCVLLNICKFLSDPQLQPTVYSRQPRYSLHFSIAVPVLLACSSPSAGAMSSWPPTQEPPAPLRLLQPSMLRALQLPWSRESKTQLSFFRRNRGSSPSHPCLSSRASWSPSFSHCVWRSYLLWSHLCRWAASSSALLSPCNVGVRLPPHDLLPPQGVLSASAPSTYFIFSPWATQVS